MENTLVGFKEYNGKKSDLLNVTIESGDIVFGIDSETNLPYIYHNGVFYSDTSKWSEALPEIHIGPTMPPEKDPYIKLWIDTDDNPPTLKYKNSYTNDWEDISSNIDITETNEIFIGDNLPADISDNIKVWYQTNVDLPEEDTTVNWDDINDKPKFADVAFTGDFNDLINKPSFEGGEVVETCTVYGVYDGEDPRVKMTHEWALSNKDAFIKIENSRKNGTPLNINIVVPFYNGTEVLYEDCYVVSGGEYSYALQSATVVKDMSNPYISYVEISTFTNGFKYYEEGQNIPGCYADIYKTPLTTDSELLKHTTTYIGTGTPSNKYNLWVDTTNEEVVFKYKDANNAWQILSTGGNDSIEVDTELSATSENPIANKVIHELATVIGKDFETINQNISKKANTEKGLVEGRGFKVADTKKYYLPDAFVEGEEDVENTNILATKAEVLSNEVIDNKATVYNLYAMDELTAEQLAANEAALVSVQNREVAIYKVYTNDDTYAIADVKIVDGPYLEAYVYVSNPDTTSEQATITKYTYSFNQAGEYLPSDKDVEEVIVPSIAKVNELISSGGTGGSGGGLETRIVYIPSYTSNNTTLTNEEKEYNLETCRKLLNGTARAALSLEGDTVGVYALNTYCEDILDLSVFGEEGYYIPFKWAYMVQLGATIIGNDGDILLFGGGQSTPVSDLILNEDLSNLGDIGSAAMEQYSGGKLPTVYYVTNNMGSLLQLVPLHPFGMFSNLGILFQGIGESFDGSTQTKYNLSCYNPATGVAHNFEATPIATKIYIGKPSTEHKNINKAFANSPIGALGIGPMPALVYEDSSSAEILRWKSYQPLEKYIVPNLDSGDWGDYTHIEFLIFREGKYERWKLDMEGETSLIE